MCDLLRDLVPYVEFKEREKHSSLGVCFTILKSHKWYQIAQRISYLHNLHAHNSAFSFGSTFKMRPGAVSFMYGGTLSPVFLSFVGQIFGANLQ